MSRIQSSVGLITGIPIEETVTKLMAIAARPRDLLDARTKTLTSEQLAVTKLSSLVLAFQFETNKLSSTSLFRTKEVASSNDDVLSAALQTSGNPAVGTYNLRVLQTASSQQLVSNSFASAEDLAAAGTLSFGFGGFVDTGISLSELNGGSGVSQGKIRITDRAGEVADIDLRAARTIDEVLRAINESTELDVTAVVDGDRFKLIDSTGGSGNLRVQEVGSGTTAADLGLSGINVAANETTGADVFALHALTQLSLLNDGNGVELQTGDDLAITLADSTTLNVDLGSAETLGAVLTALNAANPAKFSAAIAADGSRLELTDLTTGGTTFAVANVGVGSAAKDLGLTVASAGDTITGRRLSSGLRDTLAASLRGGQGLGTLGVVDITNRNSVISNVDLSATETLAEVVDAINDQATGVTASINSARSGILLTDTTGATASNLIVANGDANNSATSLGIAANVAAKTVNSGTLSRQQVSRSTLLSTLNQGKGVGLNDFRVTDSNSVSATVDMNTLGNEPETVGDVIDRINALAGVNVDARINDTGDGILLIDRANGAGTLKVAESGTGTAAADLRLLGVGVDAVLSGQSVQLIDGTSRYSVDLSDLDGPGENISLSSLNGGEGVDLGAFRITDSNGASAAVILNSAGNPAENVADVIDAINATNIGVEARIDASGSGILLFDTVNGSGTLAVAELAGGTTAADLGFDADVKNVVVDGELTQAIDGLGTFGQSADQSALAALVTRINSLSAGVSASTVFDGERYRLSLTVDEGGAANELLVDGAAAGLDFEEFSAAQDAVIEFGGSQSGSGVVIASSSNTFDSIVNGLSLTAVKASDETISIDVSLSTNTITEAVQDFVDAYNSIQKNLDQVTAFNETELTTGILFGTTAALRVESDLSFIVSGRFAGLGSLASLEDIGISLDDQGKLSLDKSKLEDVIADDPNALANFFTHKSLGVSAKMDSIIERLSGEDGSTLSARAETLATQIEKNTERLEFMDERLERQRDRLFNQFALLESTVARMQQSLAALDALQIIPPLSVSR